MLSDNNQKAGQAQRDFVNAVLRRRSGAVIAGSRLRMRRSSTSRSTGDSAAVKAQKARNRQIAIPGPVGRSASWAATATCATDRANSGRRSFGDELVKPCRATSP